MTFIAFSNSRYMCCILPRSNNTIMATSTCANNIRMINKGRNPTDGTVANFHTSMNLKICSASLPSACIPLWQAIHPVTMPSLRKKGRWCPKLRCYDMLHNLTLQVCESHAYPRLIYRYDSSHTYRALRYDQQN